MPYRKSKARKEFEDTANQLLLLARQISYKKVTLSYDHKNLIFQSSIVLLCSSIEEFLRVFIEDLIFNYKTKSAPLSDVPTGPRTYSLFIKQRTIYEGFVQSRDEAKVLEKLNIEDPMYSILDPTTVLTYHIDPQLILKERKYPSPKNLKVLFNRLGIKQLFAALNARGKKDYELLLRSFLDIRETIAHQESASLTFTDVDRHFKNVTDFIDKVDRTLYSHICSESGEEYWK
ncbi:MAG: HEPN domain-containing protein [Bacteroidota bacterium]